MEITKIDAAGAQIDAAIRLYFADDHPVPVYALAAAAREILTTIGEKGGINTLLRSVAESGKHPFKDLVRDAHEHAAFFKHADRDATSVLENFEDKDARVVLFIANQDFRRVTGGMSLAGEIFEAWWFATQFDSVSSLPISAQASIRKVIRLFGVGLRSKPLSEQKRAAADMFSRYRDDAILRVKIQRDVGVILASRKN